LIYDEPRREGPKVTFITRGGATIVEDRMTQGNIAEDLGIGKAIEKTRTFDANKERQIFEEARQEFKVDQCSSSKIQPKIK
jgi:hypothetical protein